MLIIEARCIGALHDEALPSLSQVREAKLAKSKPKTGDYDLFATRFFGEDNKMMMSCLLHGSQGNYDASSLEAWNKLLQKYGDTVPFTAPQ